MPTKGVPRLNRIYIRQRDIVISMYRRSKETGFTTEDLMRLHWDRQGKAALSWARTIIKRMRDEGIVVVVKQDAKHRPEGDGRRRLYSFTEEYLKRWNLYEPPSSTTATCSTSSTGEATSESSKPPE